MYESRESRIKRYEKRFAGRDPDAREARNTGHPIESFTNAFLRSGEPDAEEALKPALDEVVLKID